MRHSPPEYRNLWSMQSITSLCGMLLLCACGSTQVATEPAIGELQLASLNHVYYADNPLPEMPDPDEIDEAKRRVAAANAWERDLLTDLYPGAPELWALALRDSDGDGIHDYRISDYYGKFQAGDTDVDGDGIANELDAEPYTVSAPTSRDGMLPAHLRWSATDKPAEARRIQETLYREHGILLVERSAAFTPELVKAIDDVVTQVYRSVFDGGGQLSTLRVVATEESSLLTADAEEGASDFAQVLPATQTLEIYRTGIDTPPAIQLGFLAHEVGHNLQFAMDYDDAERLAIIQGTLAEAPEFHALIRQFDWDRVATPDDPEAYFTLFRPQYIAPQPWEYRFRDESLEAWADWLAAIYEETGEVAYLDDERIVASQVPGDYSMSSPWEWYSDHLIAYLYLAMFDSLRGGCTDDEVDAAEDAFQQDVVYEYWPYFRFENVRGDPFQHWLADTYPLDSADIGSLASDYLSPYTECATSTE